MSTMISTAKLHLNKREATLVVPLYITAMCAIISVLIALLFWRAGSIPGSDVWVQSSRMNPGILYALVGFLVYLGVQSVSTTFPFALALGSTRRAFTAGTLLWWAVMAAYLTVIFGILMLLERATGHWFFGFYVFDVNVLGAGSLIRLVPIVFLGVLTCLSIGGAFGASWVRLKNRGPISLAFALAVVIIVLAIIVIPEMASIVAAFRLWWLAVAAGVVVIVSCVGTWAFLRSAIVR